MGHREQHRHLIALHPQYRRHHPPAYHLLLWCKSRHRHKQQQQLSM